jgi:L-alanine-DL-glutamate epimerase-like enolase superfamily enzyme
MSISRRKFVGASAAAVGRLLWPLAAQSAQQIMAANPKGVRIADVSTSFEDFLYRAPYRFGGRDVDRVTLLNVSITVRTRSGRSARGVGSMTMGNVWAFPSATMSYDTTLGAMKALAARIRAIVAGYNEYAHPVEVSAALEPVFLKAASEVSVELKLDQPIPKLCTLVTASPFDAAMHDAFGKAHGLSAYAALGAEYLPPELSEFLTAEFRGEHLDRYILNSPKPQLAVFHSVGASDAIVEADIHHPIGDGLPETLAGWIPRNGLTHFKIKLDGNDLDWDVERVLKIDRVVGEEERRRGVSRWFYSLDFNERCPNVEYLLDFIRRVKEKAPGGFERIQYIEQPTARDLKRNRANDMHRASKLVPVVIDESLTGLDSLLLAREMGYTGIALKACKGISQSLLAAAAGQKYKMFLCVQDLTCPGLALLESAGLAAHVPGADTIEANAREYVPAANSPWEKKFPGIFVIKDGTMRTSELNGPGLGTDSGKRVKDKG